MAVYQGTPLPRARTRSSAPRPPATSARVATRTAVRLPSRSAMSAYPATPARSAVPRDEPARHGARLRAVATPRQRTALMGVGVVLVLTFVGLFYVSQTFEAASARYEVDALLVERQAMLMQLKSQQGSAVSLGSEYAVQQWAQEARLDRLGRLYRFRAR